MIIDIVTYYLGGKGGAETTLTLLSNSLKKKGHTVRILMVYPPLFKKCFRQCILLWFRCNN